MNALHRSASVSFIIMGLFLLSQERSLSQTFDRYFIDKTLRVDYYHTGTKGSETLSLDAVYRGDAWAGSLVHLVDQLNLGEFQMRVYDVVTASLIYSSGYSSMFNEWQSTDEAVSGIVRTFHETVRMPYPKNKIQLTISRRDKNMQFHEIFSTNIDPNSPTEINNEAHTRPVRVTALMENGSPHEKVDLLILGDGYRKEDLEKFRNDAKHFNDVMFSTNPFKDRKKDFNVRIIEAASQDSGIDKPDKNVWKNTVFGTKYNTFGSARYVLTEENRVMRDIADAAAYDFLLILVNDNRYGGGGIYNLYTTCFANTDASGMEWQRDYVYVHEFGHSFGGLGDEYYSSQVSYNDFYQKGIEPWEPNLTALTDKKELKWKPFLKGNTELPTSWDKTAYDSLERERGKLDRLAPDYYVKREPIYQAEQKILKNPAFAGIVGAFEGAGYVSVGIYRPSLDCRMFSLSLVDFDPVCSAAINRVIDFYSGK